MRQLLIRNTIQFFLKNSILTKKQIDYLQLKLNIYIYRLDQEKIGLNPFESCNIEVNETLVEQCMNFFIPDIVAALFLILIASIVPMSMPTTPYTICLLCAAFFTVLIGVESASLMHTIIFNYKSKKYIKALQENNEI